MNKTNIACLLFILLVGCQTNELSSHMYFRELSEYNAKMHIQGTELIVVLESRSGLMVAELNHKYDKGIILLGAHRISSGEGTKEYRVQLPFQKIPVNIAERIYWVDPDGSKHNLSPNYL